MWCLSHGAMRPLALLFCPVIAPLGSRLRLCIGSWLPLRRTTDPSWVHPAELE
jgi:hypothetical protein